MTAIVIVTPATVYSFAQTAPDSAHPVFAARSIDLNTTVITFNEGVYGAVDRSHWGVLEDLGDTSPVARAISSVAVGGGSASHGSQTISMSNAVTMITLTHASLSSTAATPTITYIKPAVSALSDVSGNKLLGTTDPHVIATDGISPTAVAIQSDEGIIVTFSEPVRNVPSTIPVLSPGVDRGVIRANSANSANAIDYGPLVETTSSSGIFELTLPISWDHGPSSGNCPATYMCIRQGDVLIAEYTDVADVTGSVQTFADSAIFDTRTAVLRTDKSVYIVGSDMVLTLIEPDLDLDNNKAEMYPLDLIGWDDDDSIVTLAHDSIETTSQFLHETGDSTGIFQTFVEIPYKIGTDSLERGEEIELTYHDWSSSATDYVGETVEAVEWSILTSDFGATIELDQSVYTWTDKVFITVVAPDHNFDSNLIDQISDTVDDPLQVSTREGGTLDNYRLTETGTDTGIFAGEVTLTGFAHNADGDSKTGTNGNDLLNLPASGTGPTDGTLAADDDDSITVSYEYNNDEHVISSALIRWNVGETQWLETLYSTSASGIVRVIDPDMNWNPEEVDSFEIDVYSDTDTDGVTIVVTETREASGVFEGIVTFTPTDQSSGRLLRVAAGDTVTARYYDNTLPDPSSRNDELGVEGTTTIGPLVPSLERAIVSNVRLTDNSGNSLDTVTVGQQVQVTAQLTNQQAWEQSYAYVVQIHDATGTLISETYTSGTLGVDQSLTPSLSWEASAGSWHITVSAWVSSDTRELLSPSVTLSVVVDMATSVPTPPQSARVQNHILDYGDRPNTLDEISLQPLRSVSDPIAGNKHRTYTGSVSLDRPVYPIPFGDDPDGSHFKTSAVVNTDSDTSHDILPVHDLFVHVRVTDRDFDHSVSEVDTLAYSINNPDDNRPDGYGPLRFMVKRGSDIVTLGYAGGSSVKYGSSTMILPTSYDATTYSAVVPLEKNPPLGTWTVFIPTSVRDTNGNVLNEALSSIDVDLESGPQLTSISYTVLPPTGIISRPDPFAAYARTGDRIHVSFTLDTPASEAPTILFVGKTGESNAISMVAGSDTNEWEATYTVETVSAAPDIDGLFTFSATVKDSDGHSTITQELAMSTLPIIDRVSPTFTATTSTSTATIITFSERIAGLVDKSHWNIMEDSGGIPPTSTARTISEIGVGGMFSSSSQTIGFQNMAYDLFLTHLALSSSSATPKISYTAPAGVTLLPNQHALVDVAGNLLMSTTGSHIVAADGIAPTVTSTFEGNNLALNFSEDVYDVPSTLLVTMPQDGRFVLNTGSVSVDNAIDYGPLMETSSNSGVFEIMLPISWDHGPPSSLCPGKSSDQLCILKDDVLVVEYIDAANSLGSSQTLTSSATFEFNDAILRTDKSVYIIGSDIIVSLVESDLNLDSDVIEEYPLSLIEWQDDDSTVIIGEAEFHALPGLLRETGAATGVFQSVITLPDVLNGDHLERGEEIELTYRDWSGAESNYVGSGSEDIVWSIFTSNFGAVIELDQATYSWTDKVYLTVVAPDHNFDANLIDRIGDTSVDPLQIQTTKGGMLSPYQLTETGTDTGIFSGEVTLTGFAHDADGNDGTGVGGNDKSDDSPSGAGPTDGKIAASSNDSITVSYAYDPDTTVTNSALIRWNIGDIRWLESASYGLNSSGVVRVVDPDMNWDPNVIDTFEINVYSNTDTVGIDLTMVESNITSGIFESTVVYTLTDRSSGHRLRVSNGDTIAARYSDNTLPAPYTHNDELKIEGTTMYHIHRPLERVVLSFVRLTDHLGNMLDTVDVGQNLQVTSWLVNHQSWSQSYVYVMHVRDANDTLLSETWYGGTIACMFVMPMIHCSQKLGMAEL